MDKWNDCKTHGSSSVVIDSETHATSLGTSGPCPWPKSRFYRWWGYQIVSKPKTLEKHVFWIVCPAGLECGHCCLRIGLPKCRTGLKHDGPPNSLCIFFAIFCKCRHPHKWGKHLGQESIHLYCSWGSLETPVLDHSWNRMKFIKLVFAFDVSTEY